MCMYVRGVDWLWCMYSTLQSAHTLTYPHTHATHQEGEDGQPRRLRIAQHDDVGVGAQRLEGLFGERLALLGVVGADRVLFMLGRMR